MRNSIRLRYLLWLVPLALAVVAVACGGSTAKSPAAASGISASSGSTSDSGGTGTLSVMIKDSPSQEPTAVLVTFSALSAHKSGDGTSDGEWVTVPFDAPGALRTCDLKQLVNAKDVLGSGTLSAGHYTQLRVTITAVTIYFTTGTTGPACAATMTVDAVTPPEVGTSVDVPSDTLKLNREFDVPEGGVTTIVLDFDAAKSIHQTGNGAYKLTPVIGIVSVE